jgi:signal transduction histidine kinase
VVVATAISRHKHDEALRELLLQLAIADAVTLAAATIVGYGTARAALNPVERYRQAAADADASLSLPVPERKDDEVVRLGRTFNGLLRRVDAANQRERQFLADASHELRSPLALMRTELEMASLVRQSDTAREATYSSLRQQVERLIALSNALLDLEELRANGTAGRGRAPVDLSRLVHDVADRLRAQADGRRITVRSPDPVVVTGHERWLDLAVSNLVTNALRHGAGTVRIEVDPAGADGVTVTVADEGAGFPPDFVDHAFDRFSRADTSRTTPGTGLGLALVQAVAEAHGGRAQIEGPRVTLHLATDSGEPASHVVDVDGRVSAS